MVTPKHLPFTSLPSRKDKEGSITSRLGALFPLLLLFYCCLPTGLVASNDLSATVNFEQPASHEDEFVAILSGMQEVCPKITKANGKVTAYLDGHTLYVTGNFSNLSGEYIASHIHLGIAGRNGPVQLVLKPTLSANKKFGIFHEKHNSFKLNKEQISALENRLMYVNVHSTTIQSGELRGQLLPVADRQLHVNLLGKSQVPANDSKAQGQIVFELDGHHLTASGSFDDFTSEVAVDIAGGGHIHRGYSGQNGPVMFVLNLSLDEDKKGGIIKAADNTFMLSTAQAKRLMMEGLYVNIHSQDNRSGEVRGQISSIIKGTSFQGDLSGANEVPPVSTAASGRIFANYDGFYHIRLSGSFKDLSSPAFAAHIHLGEKGSNGPVIHTLHPRYSPDKKSGIFESRFNTSELSREQIKALFNNEFYINIHTQNNRSGELRAQLEPLTLAECGTSAARITTTGTPLLTIASPKSLDKTLKLSPNPVSNELTVQYKVSDIDIPVSIFHVSGKKVMEQILPAGSNQQYLNVQNLPSGLYIVTIQEVGKMPISKRLVKQGNH